MKKYKNTSGDVLSFTLGDGSEYHFGPGDTVSLPADNGYIQTLVGLGHLTEVKVTETKNPKQ